MREARASYRHVDRKTRAGVRRADRRLTDISSPTPHPTPLTDASFPPTGLTQAHFEGEMTMGLMIAAALAAALAAGQAPDMYVNAEGLNMARPGEAMILAGRIRTASRDWCAVHRAVLTPDSLGDASVCEREMRRRAYVALPRPQRMHFVRAGGQTALNRR